MHKEGSATNRATPSSFVASTDVGISFGIGAYIFKGDFKYSHRTKNTQWAFPNS